MGAPNEMVNHDYKAITGVEEEEMNEQPIRWGLLADLVPNKVFTDELGVCIELLQSINNV